MTREKRRGRKKRSHASYCLGVCTCERRVGFLFSSTTVYALDFVVAVLNGNLRGAAFNKITDAPSSFCFFRSCAFLVLRGVFLIVRRGSINLALTGEINAWNMVDTIFVNARVRKIINNGQSWNARTLINQKIVNPAAHKLLNSLMHSRRIFPTVCDGWVSLHAPKVSSRGTKVSTTPR